MTVTTAPAPTPAPIMQTMSAPSPAPAPVTTSPSPSMAPAQPMTLQQWMATPSTDGSTKNFGAWDAYQNSFKTAAPATDGYKMVSTEDGNQVLGGTQQWLQNTEDAARQYSATTGQQLSAYEYDKMLNPDTYTARWNADGTAKMAGANGTQYTPGGYGQTPGAPAPGALPPTPYAISTVKPTLRTVNRATETTQGQLDAILAANSPLMQRAQSLALQQANERGLVNSSMAAGAGTAAMIDAATPIANADANTYSQAARDNQQFSNAADVFNSQAYNDAQAAGFDASQKILQIQTQGQIDMGLQQIKNETSIQLAQIEAQYKTVMQSNASAAQLYGDISKNITSIVTNKDIPADQKQSLINQQSELLRSGLAIAAAGSNQDFLSLLDFTGGTGSSGGGTQFPGPNDDDDGGLGPKNGEPPYIPN